MVGYFIFMWLSWQLIDAKVHVTGDSALTRFDGYKLWGLGMAAGLALGLPFIITGMK
jgi:hypothetical protein